MDEPEVRFLAQPSFQCALDIHGLKGEKIEENSITNSKNGNIFMIVMTLSAPKNFEARKFIRNSVSAWAEKTSRKEGKFYILIFGGFAPCIWICHKVG